jgi:hypothetical protein
MVISWVGEADEVWISDNTISVIRK